MKPNEAPYNRKITYLRISVTDRCNLRCIYCAPATDLEFLARAEILRYEEILKIVDAATQVGINKVRLTGGEPLVRRNFLHFVASLCRIPGIEDVSMTTNGVLLKDMAKEIFDAGISRVNVSLDTLSPLKYAKITGRQYFKNVWEGLQEAEAVGFSPIKVNVVVMKGVNDDELPRFARLSVRRPYHVRFIEYMPVGGGNRWKPEKYIPSDEIKSRLEAFGPLHRIPRGPYDGPADRYRFKSARGEIGFISALSHHFCQWCNRLRLTADGKLRPCLFTEDEVDVKTPLRKGCGQEELMDLFQEAIAKKPRRHHAGCVENGESVRPMYAIGG